MNFDIDEEIGGFQNWDMVQDTNGYVFVGYSTGILLFDGIKWEAKHVPNAQHVHSLLLSSSGMVFYGSENELGFLARDELNDFKPVSLKDKLPDNLKSIGDIWNIYELDGEIYFQINGGFLVWDHQNLSFLPTNGSTINTFFYDGKIIAQVRNKGLFSITSSKIEPYDKFPFLNSVNEFIYALIEFENFSIAGIRKKGLIKLNNNSESLISEANSQVDLVNETVYRALKIGKDRIALATQNSGVLIFSNSGKFLYSVDEGNALDSNRLTDNAVYNLKFDSEGELWVLQINGISKIDINSAVSIYEKRSKFEGEVQNIEVINNQLIIKTDEGNFVKYFDERHFKRYEGSLPINDSDVQVPSFQTTDLTEIYYQGLIDDTIRIGTRNGLFKLHDKDSFPIKDSIFKDEDILSGQVFRFHQDQNGDVWFRAQRKIKLFTKEPDNSYKKSTIEIPEITKSDIIFNITSLKDLVWFASYDRIFELNKTKLRNYNSTFKTNIIEVYVSRDSLIYSGFGEPNEKPILYYNENEIRFAFSASSYKDSRRNEFQVLLEGFDEKWSSWSPETQKDYTNIPEGEYTFRVRSRNVYEYEGIPDEFSFTILPPWYRTWWAYMLYVIVIAGILYGIYKIRINQILKIQVVRNRIADDLHDDLSGTLIGISNFAKAITKNPNKETQERFIGLIEKSADEAKEKISDIVWTINPTHDEWTNFLTKCRRHASDILEAQGIDYSLEMDESIPGNLDMELRKNLWLIFKEIITNITKHSEADYVLISFKTHSNRLHIKIRDNGTGFDMKAIESGNGIQSITKRVEAIKGTVNLESEIGEGTKWEIDVPL